MWAWGRPSHSWCGILTKLGGGPRRHGRVPEGGLMSTQHWHLWHVMFAQPRWPWGLNPPLRTPPGGSPRPMCSTVGAQGTMTGQPRTFQGGHTAEGPHKPRSMRTPWSRGRWKSGRWCLLGPTSYYTPSPAAAPGPYLSVCRAPRKAASVNSYRSLKQHHKVDFLFLISQMGKLRLSGGLTLGPKVSVGSRNGQVCSLPGREGPSVSPSPTRATLRCGGLPIAKLQKSLRLRRR